MKPISSAIIGPTFFSQIRRCTGKLLRWLSVFALASAFLNSAKADGQTAGMSELSKMLYAAVLNQTNEVWAENKPFMVEFSKTDGSEASLYSLKQKFSYDYATEQMTVAKARKVIPALRDLDDASAFQVIWHGYYPTADESVAARILGYNPGPTDSPAMGNLTKYAGTIVFWLLVLGGVTGYFRARTRHLQTHDSMSETANPLVGIHGWLAFFVVCLGVFGPALNLGSVAGSFHDAEKASAYLANTPAWKAYQNAVWIALAAASAFSIFAAIQMRFNWTPPTVTLAKVAVASWPVVSLLIGIVIPDLVLAGHARGVNFDFAGAFFSSLASSIIWITFLSKSERVRATYVSRP